jgi:hypothetical protein
MKQLPLPGMPEQSYSNAVNERDQLVEILKPWPCGKDEAVILSLVARLERVEKMVMDIHYSLGINCERD